MVKAIKTEIDGAIYWAWDFGHSRFRLVFFLGSIFSLFVETQISLRNIILGPKLDCSGSNEIVWMDIFPDWLFELVYSCSVLIWFEYKYFLSTKEIETISSRLMTQPVLRLNMKWFKSKRVYAYKRWWVGLETQLQYKKCFATYLFKFPTWVP